MTTDKITNTYLMTGKITDMYLAQQFIKRILKPFEEWEGFEAGLIDKDGNLLKKRPMMDKEEKEKFGRVDQIIAIIKQILKKVPNSNIKIATAAAAVLLLKEYHNQSLDVDNIEEALDNEYVSTKMYSDMRMVESEEEPLDEDAAVNAVGGGSIAGVGVGPQGEPGMGKSAHKRYIKKNKSKALDTTSLLRRK